MNFDENYQNRSVYPLTTIIGLTYEEQVLIDHFNYRKIENDWKRGYQIKPKQIAKWKELCRKLSLPFLPKDNQKKLPLKLSGKVLSQKFFTVSEVAKAVSLSVSGIYYYEKEGLIKAKTIKGRHYYSNKTIEKIRKIKELERSYFLDTIKKIIDT